MNPAWVAVALGAATAAARIFLWIDDWVHRRKAGETAIGKDVQALKRMVDEANDRASKDQSRWQDRIGKIELDIVRINEHLVSTDRDVAELKRAVRFRR